MVVGQLSRLKADLLFMQVPIYKPAEMYLMFTSFLTDTLNDLTTPVVGTLPIPDTGS